eukprot:403359101
MFMRDVQSSNRLHQNPLKVKTKQLKDKVLPNGQVRQELHRINSFIIEEEQSPIRIKMRRALQMKILQELENEESKIELKRKLEIASSNLFEQNPFKVIDRAHFYQENQSTQQLIYQVDRE